MRDLTIDEKRILTRIFEELPEARTRLSEQAASARVTTIDDEGSLKFFVPATVARVENVKDRVPVTMSYDDDDGLPVYLLLHLEGGLLSELEIYKADGSKISRRPAAEKLHL